MIPELNIYKVTVRKIGARYWEGDLASSGGSYDVYYDFVVTSTSVMKAVAAIKAMHKDCGYECRYKAKLLLKGA